MPGYLVTSESNNGKTSIAMRFAGLHPPVFSEADNKMQMPVMLLEVVPTPTEAAIIERILSILGIPYRLTDPVPDKREAAIVAMRNAGLQLLMLDELQKILGARLEQRRAVMDALRYIANQVPDDIAREIECALDEQNLPVLRPYQRRQPQDASEVLVRAMRP